jgi:hypothetical protein
VSASREALILFAVVVGILVYVKGQEIDIPYVPGGTATANGLGPISTGDQP